MKNVDVGDRKLGPEYVTPVGIAVTACTNMAYDFLDRYAKRRAGEGVRYKVAQRI